jgi:hypothetical protein
VALAEAHIAPAVAPDTLVALAEAAHRLAAGACIVPVLVLAAGRLAGLGPLQPPGRFVRHSQRARWFRSSCKIFGPEGTVCHKKGKTLRISYPKKACSGGFLENITPQQQCKDNPIWMKDFNP